MNPVRTCYACAEADQVVAVSELSALVVEPHTDEQIVRGDLRRTAIGLVRPVRTAAVHAHAVLAVPMRRTLLRRGAFHRALAVTLHPTSTRRRAVCARDVHIDVQHASAVTDVEPRRTIFMSVRLRVFPFEQLR